LALYQATWAERLARACARALLGLRGAASIAPSLLWLALLTYFSALKSHPGGGSLLWAYLGNLFHAPLYGLLALWLVLLLPREDGWPELGLFRRASLTAAVVLVGVLDELNQGLHNGTREMTVLDLVTDAAGAWATLNAIAALGPKARGRGGFPRRLALGLALCLAAAALATFGAGWVGDLAWP
jgi:hypothetical protein